MLIEDTIHDANIFYSNHYVENWTGQVLEGLMYTCTNICVYEYAYLKLFLFWESQQKWNIL